MGGISLSAATLTDRGFAHDRRWMLTDEHGRFLTQRTHHIMTLFSTSLEPEGLRVQFGGDDILVPYNPLGNELMVDVWSSRCRAVETGAGISHWFSERMGQPVKLVYMPDKTRRRVDGRYVHNKELVSFADDFPLLMIGQASLDDLNSRLATPVPMDRFRPNIVFNGGNAFAEDAMDSFWINNIRMRCVKPCARCVVTTIDQQTGAASKEPLKTLAKYRTVRHKVMFGQNVVYENQGQVRLGDALRVEQWK